MGGRRRRRGFSAEWLWGADEPPERQLTAEEIDTLRPSTDVYPDYLEEEAPRDVVTEEEAAEAPFTAEEFLSWEYRVPTERVEDVDVDEECSEAAAKVVEAEEQLVDDHADDDITVAYSRAETFLFGPDADEFFRIDVQSTDPALPRIDEEVLDFERSCMQWVAEEEVHEFEDLEIGEMSGWLYTNEDGRSRAELQGTYGEHTRISIVSGIQDAEVNREGLEAIVEDMEEQLHEFED